MPQSCNGCALKNNSNNHLVNNSSVTDLIIALINSLSQSNILTPTNAAPLIDAITQISTYNGQHKDNSVELSECNTQEK